MAKKEILYYCEICGKRFEKLEGADVCEKSHFVPIEINNYGYDRVLDKKSEYPLAVKIKVKNGYGIEKIIEYSRK